MASLRDVVLLSFVSANGSVLRATPNHYGNNAANVTGREAKRRVSYRGTVKSGSPEGRQRNTHTHITPIMAIDH